MAMTLIDGHNLIAALPDISLADPDDEQQLLTKLERLFARVPGRVVVVFDPGPNPPLDAPPPPRGRVEAIFARPPDRADDVLMQMIRRDPNPKHVTVVTGDREILACANRHRCRTVAPERLRAELERRGARRRRAPRETPAPTGELGTETYLESWFEYFGIPPEEREA